MPELNVVRSLVTVAGLVTTGGSEATKRKIDDREEAEQQARCEFEQQLKQACQRHPSNFLSQPQTTTDTPLAS